MNPAEQTQTTAEKAWRKVELPRNFGQQSPFWRVSRYGLAILMVAAAMWLRRLLEAWIGNGLPPYIVFYPAMMLLVVLTGFGPSVLATVLMALIADYWILPPVGEFTIASPVDRLGLAIFTGTNLFMCLIAEIFRRNRDKAASYEREAALHESRARLATFAEATFEGIVESEAGRIVDCNEQLARMLGYAADELKGMRITDIIAPEDLDRVAANIEQGQESIIEHAVIRKDGTRIIVEAHGRPVSPGSTVRHTVLRNITKRKQVEVVLQNTLQRFYFVLSNMYVGVLLVTEEGRIEFANQAFCDIFCPEDSPPDLAGLNDDDIIDKIKNVYLSPDDAIARIREILDRGKPVKGEELATRNGRTLLRDFVPLNVQGTSYGRLWLHLDITERKQAEEALQQSEALYRGIGESIDYGVWVCAPDGRNTYASDSFLKMVGITQEQCSNFGWGNVLHPDDAERTIAAWRECVRTGGKWDIEHRFRSADGQWRHVLARGTPVKNKQGDITCWAGINLDISRLKQAEEQIRASLAEKEVMLREIHHRVKNNLQIISSLVSLQADNLPDERMRELFGDVRDRVRAMALVHEKLYQTGDLARLNFADYAAGLLQYLWRTHGALAGKVRLDLAFAPLTLPIEIAVSCGLILNELAGNALKHAFPNGSGGEVMVSLEHDPAIDSVCLRVRDNGAGLPAGLDWRQSRSLGLRLVQMLAGQLRGRVDTGTGPGTEFRVTFPLKGFQT